MLGKLLCRLGLHKLETHAYNMQNITNATMLETHCQRCGQVVQFKTTVHLENVDIRHV